MKCQIIGTMLCFIYLCAPPAISAQQPERLDLDGIVTFDIAGTEQPLTRSEIYDVEIDQIVQVNWNEALFSKQLGISLGLLSEDEPLLERIQFLEDIVGYFHRSQELLAALKEAVSRLEAAKLAKSDNDTLGRLRDSRDETSNSFSREAYAGLSMVKSARNTLTTPEDRALASDLYEKIGQAVLIDYDAVSKVTGDFLTLEINKLNRELTKRLDHEKLEVQVFMEAWLTGDGAERPLHLNGYDNLSVGRPIPFSRFQVSIPERTAREIESAQKMGAFVNDPDQLKIQIKSAVAAIQEELTSLASYLNAEVLEKNLTGLVENLQSQADGFLMPIENQTNDLVYSLKDLLEVPVFETPESAASIVQLMRELTSQTNSILISARSIPKKLSALADTLEEAVGRQPDLIESETIQALRQAANDIRNRSEIIAVFNRIEEVGNILGITSRVSDAGLGAGTIGRSVAKEESLDTALELISAGERHPGDTIIITMRVATETDTNREIVIAQAHQRFKLRVFGFYAEPRGSLLFVDPQKNEFNSQSYEPAIAISFVGHFGMKESELWNDFLNPGIGLTFSLLDFEDNRDLELGISGSLTLLDDLLWAGYGRNLQAEANFFYIGINPLALGDFFKKSSIFTP